MALYGLFERPRGSSKGTLWTRLYPTLAYSKGRACVIFQTALLAFFWHNGCKRRA